MYNVEKSLDACLNSLLNQTYHNLDIILINDGSSDNTLNIANSYLNDSRFRIFSQENKGLSSARNVGLDNMRGDYCMFVDSDDEVLESAVEDLYRLLIENDCDISVCDFVRSKDDIKIKDEIIKVYENNEIIENFYNSYLVSVVQWNKLFKKEIFDDIRFPLGKYHEDEYVVHKEFYNAKRVVYTNKQLYIYNYNPEGIMANDNMEKRYHACEAMYERIRFFDEHNLKQFMPDAYFGLLTYIRLTLYKSDEISDESNHSEELRKLKRKIKSEYRFDFFTTIYYSLKYIYIYVFES